MKNSIWDILTGITLLGILCLIAGFGAVVMNPGLLGLNRNQPNTPGELVPTIAIPTETETIAGLPPTWTPTPVATKQADGGVPTLRPSSTPVPTNTPVILPTFTATKKVSTGGGGGGGTGGVSGGVCSVVYQSPADNSVMSIGQGFTARWTLKNTSSTTWRNDSIDLRVAAGTRMHTGADLRDLPSSVGSQGMVDILIDMIAPSTAGTYTESWALTQGLSPVCNFFVTIQVK
jgi:hypothetical protein